MPQAVTLNPGETKTLDKPIREIAVTGDDIHVFIPGEKKSVVVEDGKPHKIDPAKASVAVTCDPHGEGGRISFTEEDEAPDVLPAHSTGGRTENTRTKPRERASKAGKPNPKQKEGVSDKAKRAEGGTTKPTDKSEQTAGKSKTASKSKAK